MKDYSCIKCNSKDLFIDVKGTQTGLYCGDCGRWQKWLPKQEIILVNSFIESRKEK
jgi:transcription elongation factor Elf1